MMFREVEVIAYEGAVTAKEYVKLTEHAMRFESDINIENAQRKINVKSVMGVLSLGLKSGDKVTVVVKGSDENEALDEVCRILHGGWRG